MVTSADISADGKKLAVLTYYKLWLFERTDITEENFFKSKSYAIDLNSEVTKQCEAITFADDKNLLLTNEQRDIYRIPLAEFKKK